MTTTPDITTVSSIARMASTAAWSAAFLSPRPIQRPAPMAAASVTRTSSRARLRSGRAVVIPLGSYGLPVRLDWEIAKRGWRRYAAYPWATAAGVFTNTIFGFLQAYILLAIYRHRADVGGFDARDVVTYVWLAQAMIMPVYIFGWQELALRIRDGSIAGDLARPLDPQRYWLAFDLGRAPYHLLFRGILPFVFGALVFELHYPSPLDAF